MRLSLVALVAMLLALPASAQVMGSTNRDAPTLEKSFAFSSGSSLHVKYTAITWASGQTMERIKTNEGTRNFVNRRAAASPLGEVTVKGKLMLGGKQLPVGKHALYFTVSDKGEWMMNLQPKSDENELPPLTLPIKLKDTKTKSARLLLDLIPVEEANQLHFGISFGTSTTRIPIDA